MLRYAIALLSPTAALLLRLAFAGLFADGLVYITFNPSVMLAALIGGIWPGLAATGLAALYAAVWIILPVGQLLPMGVADVVGLALFISMGVFMSMVAELYHRTRRKAESYGKLILLQQHDDRLRTVLENTDEGLVVSDLEGQLLFWNRAALQMHGYTSLEECRRRLPEFTDTFQLLTLDGAVLPVDQWPLARILRGDRIRNMEIRIRRLDMGWERIFNYGGNIIRNSDGLPLMSLVTIDDITARHRMEEELRQRAEEIEKVMDLVPVAIWVAHDPLCHDITGNRTANAFYEAEEGENVSANMTPVRRFYRDGRELTPEELPMQYAAAHNIDVRDTEFEVAMPSGKRRILWGYASPLRGPDGRVRGCVAAFIDLTERRQMEQREREMEVRQLEFYKHTIRAATEGKLIIMEKQEIDRLVAAPVRSWEIPGKEALGAMRDQVLQLALEAGIEYTRAYEFLGCVIEAGANAIKHADGGRAAMVCRDDALLFAMSDNGAGIAEMSLPDVALTRHYSTAGTLGMGYKLMIKFADTVYLSTGPEGTTVAIEMQKQSIRNLPGTESPPAGVLS